MPTRRQTIWIICLGLPLLWACSLWVNAPAPDMQKHINIFFSFRNKLCRCQRKSNNAAGQKVPCLGNSGCDGSYYYTDPTWGDCFDESNKEYISHSYFCLSESEIEKTHTINHKDILPKCTANKDNYFVKNNLLFPLTAEQT